MRDAANVSATILQKANLRGEARITDKIFSFARSEHGGGRGFKDITQRLGDRSTQASKFSKIEKVSQSINTRALEKNGKAQSVGKTTQISSFKRELTKEDLGITQEGIIQELKGTIDFESGTKTFMIRVDMIRTNKNSNPMAIMKNFVKIAQGSGAKTLKVDGSVANEKLLPFLQKHYNAHTAGANEIITISLK